MTVKIYLVRHATPDWSRTDIRYDIPPGPPLTAQGEAEAARLGAFLQKAGIKRILTSPLERTRRTAEIAGRIVGVEPIVDEAIAEWRRGESEADVTARLNGLWEKLAGESAMAGPIALVTHGGPVKAMLLSLGMARATVDELCRKYDRGNPLPPAGVWLATCAATETPWQLELVFTPQAEATPAPPAPQSVQTVYV
ncbi:MAG: histidine phosphatase family protein [Caldilineaceae bacterium]|nr:histidine phosphatase family protein [Caldilineaceae bacterium]